MMMVDINLSKYMNLKNLSKKLKNFDKLKEKVNLARKAQLFQLWDLANWEDIGENLKKLTGFFMVQQHLVKFWPELYSEGANKFLLTQSNSLLEVSVSEVSKEEDYKKFKLINEELLTYIVGMKGLGLMKNDNLLNVLFQHNEAYLDQLSDFICIKVNAICQAESYGEVQVNDQGDYAKYVEFYGIQLHEESNDFPRFLPFSEMVKNINDVVKDAIGEIIIYNEDDNVLFYLNIDKILCSIINTLKDHFSTETQMGIPQIATLWNNIEYLKQSIPFYQSCGYKCLKNDSIFSYNFSAFALFNQIKSQWEEKLYNLFRLKINEFLTFVKEQDWSVKYQNETPAEYVTFVVNWLRVNLTTLSVHNSSIVYSASVTSLEYLSSRILEIIANEKYITKINMNDIYNLGLDFEYIESYVVEELKEQYPRTYSALGELRQFLTLLQGEMMDFLDEQIYREKYNLVKEVKLKKILAKFKDKSKDKVVKKFLKALKNK